MLKVGWNYFKVVSYSFQEKVLNAYIIIRLVPAEYSTIELRIPLNLCTGTLVREFMQCGSHHTFQYEILTDTNKSNRTLQVR